MDRRIEISHTRDASLHRGGWVVRMDGVEPIVAPIEDAVRIAMTVAQEAHQRTGEDVRIVVLGEHGPVEVAHYAGRRAAG